MHKCQEWNVAAEQAVRHDPQIEPAARKKQQNQDESQEETAQARYGTIDSRIKRSQTSKQAHHVAAR
jgi:hypothetical protein